MAGPHITVAGAVFADRFIAVPLTDYISIVPRAGIHSRSSTDECISRIAVLFQALKTCTSDSLMISVPAIPRTGLIGGLSEPGVALSISPHPMIRPCFTSYCDNTGKQIDLVYTERLDADFIAEATSDTHTTKVVVKFAHTYNRAAHELLATSLPPQAPKLRYCAREDTVGMWVIVMDYAETNEEDGMLTNALHIASLRHAVKTLHDASLYSAICVDRTCYLWTTQRCSSTSTGAGRSARCGIRTISLWGHSWTGMTACNEVGSFMTMRIYFVCLLARSCDSVGLLGYHNAPNP